MIVYLDTNVYISAKYIFDSGNFATLKKLVDTGKIAVIYTSATIGEVKQHIKDDISSAVTKYNRILRKDMAVLDADAVLNLKSLDVNQIVEVVINKLNDFIGTDGVKQISLNPLDAEKLLADYFNQNPPFESKKPNEFKDAIMINAIKQFQETSNKQVYIVSNDEGFRKAFVDNGKFTIFNYISEFLKYCNKFEEEQENVLEFITNKIDNGDFEEVIKEYLADFDIDRDYYAECDINSGDIDEICCELLYIEEIDGNYVANITADIEISIDITYRDEENSYYDKEENEYLIENFIHAIEKHRVTITVAIECDIICDGANLSLNDINVIEDKRHKYINLDEETMFDSDEVENTIHEEPDLEYCSECGALLGRTQNGAYFDYDGNPICDKCMQVDSKSDICPSCGCKVPYEHMMSGFCDKCAPEVD